MKKIIKGDDVIVIAGRSKGVIGTVLRVLGEEKIIVSGANTVKKHVKPNPQLNQEGGIVEREAPIHISNIAIYNPSTKKADRVGFKFLEDGKKLRVYKSTGEQIGA